MGVASCLFVASARAGQTKFVRRAQSLARYYDKLGAAEPVIASVPEAAAIVGEIELDALDGGRGRGYDDDVRVLAWGGPFPSALRSGTGLIGAADLDLREIDGFGVMIGTAEGRVRVVTAPDGPTSLYVAKARGQTVWSTHAVAAAFLCHGRVELEPASLPALVATEFVGGADTHLRGVRAVPAATRIDLSSADCEVASYWPEADRWEPLPEAGAYEQAESALLECLGRRTDGIGDLRCGLTAGMDSRVVAVALTEVGRDYSTFTWGLEDWPDASGAAEVAAELGVDHRIFGFRWNDDDGTRAAIDASVRWSEGLEPTHGFGWPDVPQNPGAIVTGRGGETGRAFFYRRGVDHSTEPSRDDLVDAFLRNRPARLSRAGKYAKVLLRESVERWVDAALALGHSGWRALDVVYGRERLTRWDRTRLMRQRSLYVPALDGCRVQRALLSLPLEMRLNDGFHRRFLATRRPGLEPSPAARMRPPEPTITQRVRARLARTRSAGGPQWPFKSEWEARPETLEWIRDGLLTNPLLSSTFGSQWSLQLRRGLDAGEAAATTTALMALAPMALAETLKELRSDARQEER